MRRFGFDLGAANTVVAVWNDTLERPETIEVPGLSHRLTCTLEAGAPELATWAVPSVIHYGEKEILVGQKVLDAGLYEHPWTIRFFKRDILRENSNNNPTGQGPKTAQEAGRDFLGYVFGALAGRFSPAEDEITFTAPCEAFEPYHEWLSGVLEPLGLQRVRYLDEPTACILGCYGRAQPRDKFAVFDFGASTLDVSVVEVNFHAQGHRLAVVCGEAGVDVGGMDLDALLRDDFIQQQLRASPGRERLKALVLMEAEKAKIALSDPGAAGAQIEVLDGVRPSRMDCVASCPVCAGSPRAEPPRGLPAARTPGCLGCLMREPRVRFLASTQETLERALKSARDQAQVEPGELKAVFVTGGTSLIPAVRALLDRQFPGKVGYRNPFDAVAQGACRLGSDEVVPLLLHDYAVESHNPLTGKKEEVVLFEAGTVYPTDPGQPAELWAEIILDGQTRIVPKILEKSKVKKRRGLYRKYDDGSDCEWTWINQKVKTRIIPHPPAVRARDKERFLCQFSVNGNKQLLVTVKDFLAVPGRALPYEILKNHMVVRL